MCYNCIYGYNDMVSLNEGFAKYREIYEIYKKLNEYIDTSKEKININIKEDNITIKCKDYFNNNNNANNDIIFTLHPSFYTTRIAKTSNHSITYTSIQTPFSSLITPPLQLQNPIIQLTFPPFHLHSHFLIHILSFILILFLSLFIIAITFNKSPSLIIKNREFNLISLWIDPNKQFKYTLLYRATRDGDSSLSFHNLCDNKGKTVTLISTTKNLTFGGYSDVEWETLKTSDEWKYRNSDNAFLFSMDKKKKYGTRKGENNKAVFMRGINGPTFGFGHDLVVVDKCLREISSCNSPVSYRGMEKNNEFNNEERDFVAKEVEVFLVENVK